MKSRSIINKLRSSKKSIRLTLLTIVMVGFACSYYFLNRPLAFRELPFNTLIEDEKCYSKSDIMGWHKIDVGPFTIDAPISYFYFRLRGIDTYVGGITNKKDTLIFDYGLYSYDFSDLDNDSCLQIKSIAVNKKRFKIVQQKANSGLIGAYTNDLPKEKEFMITCKKCEQAEEKMKILQTIEFKH